MGHVVQNKKQSMVNADEKQPETVYQGMTGKTVEKQDVISSDSEIKVLSAQNVEEKDYRL